MTQSLPTAILGHTGLKVSRLGYGAGHRHAMDDEQMEAQLNAVQDAGIIFLDTANDYGDSEEMIVLAHALRDRPLSGTPTGWVRPSHQMRLPPGQRSR